MAQASELVVGEVYDYRGRRARVDSVAFDGNRVARVAISTGRNLDQQQVVSACGWAPGRIDSIGATWEESKQRKRREKHFRDQSRELCARLRALPPELELTGAHISSSGRLSLHGSLEGLSCLVEALEHYAENPKYSALSDLLSCAHPLPCLR